MGLVVEPHVHSFLRCNIWHLRGLNNDLVVDAGLGVHSLRTGVPQLFEREPALFLTTPTSITSAALTSSR